MKTNGEISSIHARILSMRRGAVNPEDDPEVMLRRSELLTVLHTLHTLVWKLRKEEK